VSDYLLVGLGNPGKEYISTRHNFGFLVVSHFADLYQIKFVKSVKYHGMIGAGSVEGKKVHLLLPLTYMNVSGLAVNAFAKDKEICPENILVVCDDLNLDFGELRIRPKGSAGGHNGLSSVLAHLNSHEIPRLRLGIGAPKDKDKTKDFVLSVFKVSEKKRLQEIVSEAVDCCHLFLMSGISQAMTRFNKRSKQEEEK
jgi:PTH1 family peptidyl-tRNA hydrolase